MVIHTLKYFLFKNTIEDSFFLRLNSLYFYQYSDSIISLKTLETKLFHEQITNYKFVLKRFISRLKI